jgi:Flp pilus assembly protein TadD
MLAVGVAQAGAAAAVRARALYENGDFEGAISQLKSVGALDADELLLAGQVYLKQGDARTACSLLEKAAEARPSDSRRIHWLGRAYGRRAETGSFLIAPRYAVKARQCFENAVRLDPSYAEAWNDLFAYYLEAPRFLGGGLDKAAGVSERMRALDLAEHHFDEARLAEKRGQPALAEAHYRHAADSSPGDPGRLVDLARFLEGRGRREEADRLLDRAHQVAPQSSGPYFEHARIYVLSRRRLHDARNYLTRYLSMKHGPDDPPRSEAIDLLSRIAAVIGKLHPK